MVRARATYLSKNWKRAMTENAQKIEHTTNPTHMTHMRKKYQCVKKLCQTFLTKGIMLCSKMHKAVMHSFFQVLTNLLSERWFTCSPILIKTVLDEVTLTDSLRLLENRGLKLDLLFHGCFLVNISISKL